MTTPNRDDRQLAMRPSPEYQNVEVFLTRPEVLDRLTTAMRPGGNAENLVRQFLTIALIERSGPALLQCTFKSLGTGIMRAGELGLELAGPLGHCYLIARRNKKTGEQEANFQLGYKGIMRLAWRSGLLRHFAPRAVHEGDLFNVRYGTNQDLVHVPGDGSEDLPITHYYAVVQFTTGGHDFEVMTMKEMEAHRDRYAADKGSYSPWTTSFDAMAKKTVLMKLGRRLSLCPEAQAAVISEEYAEAGHPFPDNLPRLPLPGAGKTRSQEVLDALTAQTSGGVEGCFDEPTAPEGAVP